jgi:ParB/RepB/Spo0J family partition protein
MTVFNADNNTIVVIPIVQISVKSEWNSRSGKWTSDSGDEESQEFSDLMISLQTKGQDTPVEVRLSGDAEKPYDLVKGFRRTAAILALSEKDGRVKPEVRAIVRELNEVEAREENLLENVTRQNLTPPDFAWGLHQLQLASKAVKGAKGLSDLAIANRLGRNQAYVNKLLTIMRDCKPNITRRWRETAKAVSVVSMYGISKLPKVEQDDAFGKLLGDVIMTKDGEVKAKTSWLDSTRKKARDFGTILGTLEREGLIDTSGLDFETHLDLCLKVKESASPAQRASISSQMLRGYNAAKEEREQPDLGPTGDE